MSVSSLAAPSGSGVKAQAEQLVQAALNLRVQAAEQNTIKQPSPAAKKGKVDIVV